MKVDGACHCGAVTYKAEIEPDTARLCHCTDCQITSGSAFRYNATSVVGGFELLTGELTEYIKKADSGNDRILAFCPICGTQIYSALTGDGPKSYNIRVGTCHQKEALPPQTQIWWRSALGWVEKLSTITKHERQ